MSTIGDLTPNMIGVARIRVTTCETVRDTVVEGLLSGLDITTDRHDVQATGGTRPVREVWDVRVAVTIGSVALNDLPRETTCEVIA